MAFFFRTEKKPIQLILASGQESMPVKMVNDPHQLGPFTVVAPECTPREQIQVVLPPTRQQVEVVLPPPTPGPITHDTRLKDLAIGQYGYVTPDSVIIRNRNNKLFVQTSHMSYPPNHITWKQPYKVLRAHDGFEIEGPAFIPEESNIIIDTTKPVVAWKVTN